MKIATFLATAQKLVLCHCVKLDLLFSWETSVFLENMKTFLTKSKILDSQASARNRKMLG